MAKKRIFTVGFSLPGEEFEFIEFSSSQTLLDADIVLFEPSLGSVYEEHDYRRGGSLLFHGAPILTEHSSHLAKRQVDHWRSEIVAAVNAGKLVIVYLRPPIERYRYTGEKNYSGTGKSRVASPVVVPISSYDAIPNLEKVVAKSGAAIRLEKDGSYLAPYWKEFSSYCPYEVEIEGKFNKILLRALAGERIVGAAFHGKQGVLLCLPAIQYDEEEFSREARDDEDEDSIYWSDEALKFGKKLSASLVALAGTLREATQATPPPIWTTESEYRISLERQLEAEIAACTAEMTKMQRKRSELESRLVDAGSLRRLLFEQGKPLEIAILEAMVLFGFASHPFADGESEFDGVFVGAEGRCIGEAEGKDNKAINIDKFSQLERNLQEDFARDEVTEYAKGLLFGNAFRLQPLGDRQAFFTDKCISAAKRVGVALIRTPDLFQPARYLKESPSDTDYADACRKAIFAASGNVVSFPEPPVVETLSELNVAEPSNAPSLDVESGESAP